MKPISIRLSALALALLMPSAYAEHTAPVYDVDTLSTASGGSENAVIQPEGGASGSKAAPVVPLISSSSASTSSSLSADQRISRLEQQLASAQSSEDSHRVSSLQTEVQGLRAQVEELTHRLQEVSTQQQTQRQDAAEKRQLSKVTEPTMSHMPRVNDDEGQPVEKSTANKSATEKKGPASKALASKKSPTSEKAASVPVEQPNSAEEQAVYQTAYNLIKAKKYNEAIATLQKMLSKYPSGQFAANAHYWLGELYSLTGENGKAAAEFSTVVKQYPSNPRVADAELKLGLISATELKWADAKLAFTKVMHKYPGSSSARLAMEQLKQLKQAGH